MPKFKNACEEFRERAKMTLVERQAMNDLKDYQNQIFGLLEIPQLMNSCVTNGDYDEALDFQSFVTRLASLHGDLSIVKKLMEETKKVIKLMIKQLMSKLKSELQLPECLTVIGYLRRLSIFTEKELKLCYLACREEWITG